MSFAVVGEGEHEVVWGGYFDDEHSIPCTFAHTLVSPQRTQVDP